MKICCMNNRLYFFLWLCALCVSNVPLQGQTTLEGIVTDALYGDVILFGSVVLYKNDVLITGTETDIDGKYFFSDIDPGEYDIEASHIGFDTKRIKSITVEENKANQVNIVISEGEIHSHPIIIVAPYHISQSNPTQISIQGRYANVAGSFDDPSRSLIRFPGFSNPNDQANGIVYHGLPADMMKWTMDGAEIVNPNHLANAGTLSDQSSPTSGGVLSLSQEMIQKFDFHMAPYEANQTNALSGVADIQPINHHRRQRGFFKIGLLGLEGGYMDSKVAAHYRYSTVGLLSNLGMDFGGEKIVFQDLFAKYKILDSDKHSLSLTTILGQSSNDKDTIENAADAMEFKDLQEIRYANDIGIVGLTYSGNPSNSVSTKSALYFSINNSEHSETDPLQNVRRIYSKETYKLSYAGEIRKKLSDESSLYYGVNTTYENRYIYTSGNRIYVYPFLGYDYQDSSVSFNMVGGLTYGNIIPVHNHEIIPEGSVRLAYDFGDMEVGFISSHNSQASTQESVNLPLIDRSPRLYHRMRSFNNALFWRFSPSERLSFTAKGFYQRLSDLSSGRGFSSIDGPIQGNFYEDQGKAKSYGLDIKLDKQFDNFLYASLSATIMDIKKKNREDVDYTTGVYNYGYIVNSVISKYFLRRQLYIHIGGIYRGGELTQFPPDEIGPDIFPVPKELERLTAYFRIDARVKYKFGRSELVLDIQNLTNRQNDAHFYFDRLTDQYGLRKQLGIIPILSWKYTF